MKLTTIATLLFWASFSIAQADTTKVNFSRDNYKIEYPKSWRIDTSRLMGTELVLLSPPENQSDKFYENVNLIIQDLTGQNITLENFKTITDLQINDFANDPIVFESEIIKENEDEYFRIIYAMTQGKSRLKITSICSIKNEKVYILTFTTSIESYEAYKKIGDEIVSSFRVTK